MLGKTLIQTRSYDPYSARLDGASLTTASGERRLAESYQYDQIGNVTHRTQYWDTDGFQEAFEYDVLNRLSASTMLSQPRQSFTYDAAGNMLSKTGTGAYTYPAQGPGAVRPHAVQGIAGIGCYRRNLSW